MNPSVVQLPKMISFFITCLMLSASLSAQEQKITEESVKYPTYYFGDPNPLPAFVFNPKIYPYHKFQGYEFEKSETKSDDYGNYTLPDLLPLDKYILIEATDGTYISNNDKTQDIVYSNIIKS